MARLLQPIHKDELGVDTHPSSVMEIYGASIWACNTKR